jgi:putative oxidoreductase
LFGWDLSSKPITACTSIILIALVFVVAGVQKMMSFNETAAYIGTLGLPMSVAIAALVVIIEVPVALAYAWGYNVRYTGAILAVFTFLTILVAHRDFSNSLNMVMALKNLAIIGGIVATTGLCSCNRCSAVEGKA